MFDAHFAHAPLAHTGVVPEQLRHSVAVVIMPQWSGFEAPHGVQPPPDAQ